MLGLRKGGTLLHQEVYKLTVLLILLEVEENNIVLHNFRNILGTEAKQIIYYYVDF